MSNLAQILLSVADACEIRGNVSLLEMQNAAPEDALQCLTNMSRATGELNKPFKPFMQYFVTVVNGKSPLTGSCGQTSGWLDAVTSKDGQEGKLETRPTVEILGALNEVTAAKWYCRLSTGSHSFLIEHADGRYCAYQSFHGSASVQVSIENISAGKYVFADKAEFFRLLRLALLDAGDYINAQTEAAVKDAVNSAMKLGKKLDANRLSDLSDAMTLLSVNANNAAAKKVKEGAQEWEWRIAEAYDEAIGKINDEVTESGKAQNKVFHGKDWKTVSPSQYRINIDPASDSKMTENLTLRRQKHLAKWQACFKDTESTMEAQLGKLGVKV